MLDIYLGNFHPDLEDAIVRYISDIKAKDRMSEIAVVVPSEHVRKRLRTLLTAERGMGLIGVHFLTFHSLSLKLYEEEYGLTAHMICDDFFFTEMVRHIIEGGRAGTDLFSHFTDTPEGCMAIWKTLRELREARVEPETVIDGIRDGLFRPEDCEKLFALLSVYRELNQRKRDNDIIDYSDLPDLAAGVVHSSSYLRRFKDIIYYGFYDLTQVQYDLLQAIVRKYQVTMFFPYAEGVKSTEFAGRFYDVFVRGLMNDDSKVIKCSGDDMKKETGFLFPGNASTAIINASGMEDEVSAVARMILRLVEEDGCPFASIGVVARDINEYIHIIKRVFNEHKIPFFSTGSEPAYKYPLVQAVQILISVHENDYRRTDIIDLISSHCCQERLKAFFPPGTKLQPDKLDIFTRMTGIAKGQKEWARMDKYLKGGFNIRDSGEGDEAGMDIVNEEEITGLKTFIQSLHNDFTSLPPSGSWSDYVHRFNDILRKYIDLYESDAVQVERDDAYVDNFSPAESVLESLKSLRKMEAICPEVTQTGFINTFHRSLAGVEYKVNCTDIFGVQALDAMSARAIPFRALFLVGMNEMVFPRNVREDPLLRDPVRKVLVNTLGYKIEEKLNGFEEEKLLFFLLVNAARERLYLVYQRTDDSGAAKIPSWYITEVSQAVSLKELRIPRRLSDKYAVTELFDYCLLPVRELSTRLIIEGMDASMLMSRLGFSASLYKRGREVTAHHERLKEGLTEFDGLTGPVEDYWNDIIKQGISPTSMEVFASCPFSYFARYLLQLRRIERPEGIIGIQPVDAGDICHKILKRFYSDYSSMQVGDIMSNLEKAAIEVFTEFEENKPVGYPIIWDLAREGLLKLVTEFVTADISELHQSGFKPYIFETPVGARLSSVMTGDDFAGVHFYGVVDRVDRHSDRRLFRIIDYKYKSGFSIPASESNLSISAIRGQKLQPPVYIFMVAEYLRKKDGIENPECDGVRFMYLAPNWTDVPAGDRFRSFPGNCWESQLGAAISGTIKLLLKGIRDGLYFIMPGSCCTNCEYSAICRKNHFPTRSRARRDSRIVREYRELRNRG